MGPPGDPSQDPDPHQFQWDFLNRAYRPVLDTYYYYYYYYCDTVH